ncbi:MAG: AI-2E family transporter [Elusimicrobia bacterium]|nr:AI-2E family transporter [Elusimicrobiota bacterium]
MTKHNCFPSGTHFLFIAAALVLIIWGINQAQSALVSSLVAVFLAVLGTPLVHWLERKRIPHVMAVLAVLAGMLAILLTGGGLVSSSLGGFSASLPSYQQRMQEEAAGLTALLAAKGIPVTEKVLLEYLNPAAVMKLAVSLLGGLGAALSNVVLILLTVMFILLEASSFPVKLRAVLGDPDEKFPEVTKFVSDIQRYMLVATGLNLTAGTLLCLWLTILGVDSPVLWGFLAFMLLYIPHVGSIIAAIPAVSLTLVQFGPGRAALVAAGYVVVQFTLGNVIQPKLMGRKFSLSTLVVFLSLIFWGRMLGLIGAVLCVPFTMAVKLVCEHHESTRWIAVLLGPEVPVGSVPPGSEKTPGTAART